MRLVKKDFFSFRVREVDMTLEEMRVALNMSGFVPLRVFILKFLGYKISGRPRPTQEEEEQREQVKQMHPNEPQQIQAQRQEAQRPRQEPQFRI